MDADAFSLLIGGGVKFDKQRFGKDIESFRPRIVPLNVTSTSRDASQSLKGTNILGTKRSREISDDVALFDVSRTSREQRAGDVERYSNEEKSEDRDEDEEAEVSRALGPNGDQEDLDPGCPSVHSRDPNEGDNVVRKHYRIKISGYDPPSPLRSFRQLVTKLGSPSGLLRSLVAAGYEQPTPIQRQAIPVLMAGRELLAVAPTGSGKTLAFMLPIISSLRKLRDSGEWPSAVKAVVLSPTHELAAQQARCLKLLLPGSGLRGCLLSKSTAAGSDFSKVDILLANPLRLLSLIKEGKIELSQARYLVLDEADKLFELGFMEQVDGVIAACTHTTIVRALFSATLPEKVEELARSVLQQPLRVTVGVRNSAASSVKQRLLFVGREAGKLMALRQLIKEGVKPPTLVFVGSKDRAKSLHRELMYDDVHVDSIHSEQSAAARAAAVDNFRLGRTWILIATDLIGRGMDFVGVKTVVNYDFPNSTADYIHRIGRTGRAGQQGEAVTFFTEEDSGQLRSVANLVREAGGEVPDWMVQMKRDRDKKRHRLPPQVTPSAHHIGRKHGNKMQYKKSKAKAVVGE